MSYKRRELEEPDIFGKGESWKMSDYMGLQVNMLARKHVETQSCLSKLKHISVQTCTHMHVSVYACKHVSCEREALDFYPREWRYAVPL